MAIEEGTVGDESQKEEQSPDVQAALLKQLQEMRAEIDALKKNGQPMAVVPPASANGDMLKALVDELVGRKTENAIQTRAFVSQSELDPEDVLEEPVTFFSLKVGYFLIGDMKNGIPVYSPRGAVMFKFQGSRLLQGNNKDKNIINLSRYKTYSKKEVEFLKNHSLFNVFFFLDHEKAFNMDTRRAEIMSKLVMQLQQTDSHRLVNMARDQGLPVSSSPEAIRVMLAEKMTDDRIKLEDQANEKRTVEAFKEKELFVDVK